MNQQDQSTSVTKHTSRLTRVDMGIMFLYVLGVLLYTWPMALDLSRPFSVVGDNLVLAWQFAWQCKALLANPLNYFHGNVLFPVDNSLAMATPMNAAQLIFFAPCYWITGNPIIALNTVYWGTILATAVSLFIVMRLAGFSRTSAFLSGWIFAFALAKIQYSVHQPMFWLIWTLYFWHRFLSAPQWGRIIPVALLFVCTALGSFYVMYMAFFALSIWAVTYHIRIRSLLNRQVISMTIVGGILSILLLLPACLPYFKISREYGLKRPMGEVIQYSADLLDSYVMPNNMSVVYNDWNAVEDYSPLPGEETVFKKFAALVARVAGPSVFGAQADGATMSYENFHSIWAAGEGERRLFLGYSVLFLVLLGVIARLPTGLSQYRTLNIVLLCVMIVISLGPVIMIMGHLSYLPGLYGPLYYLLPGLKGMRGTARFGYVAFLAASVLAGYGWYALRYRVQQWFQNPRTGQRVLWGSMIIWLAWFSVENFPANAQLHDWPTPPPVYEWLASQPIEGGILELPTIKGTMHKSDPIWGSRRAEYKLREYLYMYFSTIHWKNICNGAGAFISPIHFKIRDAAESLPHPQGIAALQKFGVTTLILHRYWFEDSDTAFWDDPARLDAFQLVAEIGGAQVYQLKSAPSSEKILQHD
jgi:hypothetical protein